MRFQKEPELMMLLVTRSQRLTQGPTRMGRRHQSPAQLALGAGLLASLAVPRVAVADATQPSAAANGGFGAERVTVNGKPVQPTTVTVTPVKPEYAKDNYGIASITHPLAAEGTSIPTSLAQPLRLAKYDDIQKLSHRGYVQFLKHMEFDIDRDSPANYFVKAGNQNPDNGFFFEFPANWIPKGDIKALGGAATVINSITVWNKSTNRAVESAVIKSLDGESSGIWLPATSWDDMKGQVLSLTILLTHGNIVDFDGAKRFAEAERDKPKLSTVAQDADSPIPLGYNDTIWSLKPGSRHYDPLLAQQVIDSNLKLGPEWEGRTTVEKVRELGKRYMGILKIEHEPLKLTEAKRARDVLMGKKTKCGGAAGAFLIVLSENGIKSRFVMGYTGKNLGAHAWLHVFCPETREEITCNFIGVTKVEKLVRDSLSADLFGATHQGLLQFQLPTGEGAGTSGTNSPFNLLVKEGRSFSFVGLGPIRQEIKEIRTDNWQKE